MGKAAKKKKVIKINAPIEKSGGKDSITKHRGLFAFLAFLLGSSFLTNFILFNDWFKNSPQPYVNVEFTSNGEIPKLGLTTLLLGVTLSNSGTRPFTPNSFQLELELRSNEWTTFDNELFPSRLQFEEGKQSKVEFNKHPSETDLQLYKKRVLDGELVSGTLFFVTRKISLEDLRKSLDRMGEFRYKLHIWDSLGNKHTLVDATRLRSKSKVYPKLGVTVSPK